MTEIVADRLFERLGLMENRLKHFINGGADRR
jgi:hypothetical protein